MDSTTYRAGSWLGIVRSGAVIVVDASTAADTVAALWDYLAQPPSIHGVLNAVTGRFGTELTGMPSFAILVQTDRLNVILRGEITLVVHSAGNQEVVSGREVSTWSERSLPLPDSLVLTLAQDDAGDVTNAVDLPLGEAVVRLQQLARGTARTASIGATVSTDSTDATDSVAGAPFVAPEAAGAFDGEPADGTNLDGGGHIPENSQGVADLQAADDEHGFDAPALAASGMTDSGMTDSDSGFDAGLDAAGEEEEGEEVDGFAGDGFAGDGFAGDDEMEGPALAPSPAESPLDEAPLPAESLYSDDVQADADDTTDATADHGDAADDGDVEDAYAGFALAADAEWSAQLAHPSGEIPVPDFHTGDSDLGQTLYPGLGPDNAEEDEPFNELAADDAGSDDAAYDGVHDASLDAGHDAGPELVDGDHDADGFTSSYDHLFGETELRSVEDAAVRLDENGQELPKEPAVAAVVNVPPPPPMPPATPPHGERAFDDDAESEPAETPEPAWVPPSGILIDSVPWAGGNDTGGQNATAAVVPGTEADSGDPDHDGHTVMRSELAGQPDVPAADELEPRPSTGPMVLARLCPAGHANPPTRSQCSDCGAPISSEPREVGRPRLGRMHISTGEVLDLDHSLIIGRQPSVSRVMGAVMPRLVQVHSASGDISRSHVEVRLDGWDVLLVDLKATNGTVLVREGQPPRRLGQGEQAILLNGDIAELGDGVSLLFEGLL